MNYHNSLFKKKDYESIGSGTNLYKKKLIVKITIGLILISVLGIILFSLSYNNNSQNKENLKLSNSSIKNQDDLVVSTSLGKILGKKMMSRDGREFLGFLGVPYAKPPLGRLRFSPPEKLSPWDGILNATINNNQCYQQDTKSKAKDKPILGSEDCLYLYIYTPKKIEELKKIEQNNTYPVILYIHGGANYGNASKYGPEYFMDEDVILALVDFRMNVFANLNTEDEASSGNFGLKDQVMALKWIQNNIMYFGGNPKKVTLFGNSAGSMAISSHLISNMSSGLFHRAIMQSGTLLNPKNFVFEPKKIAYELGAKMGCTNNSTTHELVNCLRQIDAEKLTKEVNDTNFWYSAEKNIPFKNAFLVDNTLTLVEKGPVNRVPTIQGVTSAEKQKDALDEFIDNFGYPLNKCNGSWDAYLREKLELRHAEHPEQITQAVHKYYFNNSENLTRDDVINLINMESDRLFYHPYFVCTMSQLKVYSQNTHIYQYVFTKVPKVAKASKEMEIFGAKEGSLGVGHSDDLQFFLSYADFPIITPNSPYYNFSKYVVKMYASFVETGDPNREVKTETAFLKRDYWHPVKSLNDKNQWFNLGDSPGMIEPIFKNRIKFWDQFSLTDLYP